MIITKNNKKRPVTESYYARSGARWTEELVRQYVIVRLVLYFYSSFFAELFFRYFLICKSIF